MATDRDALRQDLLRVAEYSEYYTCGDGCCDEDYEPLAEESARLRGELERLWGIEDALSDLGHALGKRKKA